MTNQDEPGLGRRRDDEPAREGVLDQIREMREVLAGAKKLMRAAYAGLRAAAAELDK